MFAAATRDTDAIVTQVYTCAGSGETTCDYILNTIGTTRELSLSPRVQLMATSIGIVREPHIINVSFPPTPTENMRLFTMRFTQSFSDTAEDRQVINKTVEVVLVAEKPDSETLKYHKDTVAMMGVYRRIAGEKKWTEMAIMLSSRAISDLKALIVEVKPDGVATVIYQDRGEEKRVSLHLGDVIIG
jgi:hypothetical protein